MENFSQNKEESKGFIRNLSVVSDPQLQRSFRGHTGDINSACFDSQMKQVASASNDGTVQVWNFKPQQRPLKFIGHKGPVYDVIFSPDSKIIASGGDDRQIRLWDNSVQAKCKVLTGHSGAIRNLHFSKNGELLLSASCDKTIKVWKVTDTKKNKPDFLYSLAGHKNWVRSGQFAPDNRIIGSGSDDKTVKLWDVDTRKFIHSYDYHLDSVNQIKFSPDGTCLASCSNDKSIKLYDIRSHKLIQHYDAGLSKSHQGNEILQNSVNSISFHPSGQFLASGGQDNLVKIWDLRLGKLAWTMQFLSIKHHRYQHLKNVKTVSFNNAGDYFVSGGGDNLVLIWKTNFDDYIDAEQIQSISQIQEQSLETNVQTLFKSNKKYQNPQKQSCVETPLNNQQFQDNKENIELEKPNSLLESLSGPLEKIVNQLDIVANEVRKLDARLQKNEKNVKLLFDNEAVQNIVLKKENVFNMSQYQGSMWETFKAQDKEIIQDPMGDTFKEQQEREINQQEGFVGTTTNIFSTGALFNYTDI